MINIETTDIFIVTSAQLCSNICQTFVCRFVVFVVGFRTVLEGGGVLPSQKDHVACISNLLGMGFCGRVYYRL